MKQLTEVWRSGKAWNGTSNIVRHIYVSGRSITSFA